MDAQIALTPIGRQVLRLSDEPAPSEAPPAFWLFRALQRSAPPVVGDIEAGKRRSFELGLAFLSNALAGDVQPWEREGTAAAISFIAAAAFVVSAFAYFLRLAILTAHGRVLTFLWPGLLVVGLAAMVLRLFSPPRRLSRRARKEFSQLEAAIRRIDPVRPLTSAELATVLRRAAHLAISGAL